MGKIVDQYLWLEDVLGEKSLKWVSVKSADTIQDFAAYPDFLEMKTNAEKIYANQDKLPIIWIKDEFVYNLWNDDKNPQGLFRRMTIADFSEQKENWEMLLDLDELSQKDQVKWVFKNCEISPAKTKAMIHLSRGGSDANIIMEFDLIKKEFINNGFILPESKGHAEYIDENTIIFERCFDEESITTSGYARTVRIQKRDQSIKDARTIFEVAKEEMCAFVKTMSDESQSFSIIERGIDFYHLEEFLYKDGNLVKLDLPLQCRGYGIVKGKYIIGLNQDWKDFRQSDVISLDIKTQTSEKIFSLKSNQSLVELSCSRNGFYAIIDEDVVSSLYFYQWNGTSFVVNKLDAPANGSLTSLKTSNYSDEFFVYYSSFNSPLTLYFGNAKEKIKKLKETKSFFVHEDTVVEQHFVKSFDGVKIPYFLFYKKGMKHDGLNPTILYGYGGFQVSLKPAFNNALGLNWVAKGGVYVYANIRGGGEYGPSWHQSALKENRYKAYADFFSVAEDLIQKKITSKEHLGAMGGSNGGLLMGVCYTQRPDLFRAIDCGVPLLDMHRYHTLLAGASWIAEYGNPDDEVDGAYIRSISPYHQVKPEEKNYPVMFLNTSTKDDRVHPAHARKFAAKLYEYGHPVHYFENILGGHGGAANYLELANLHALHMTFFWKYLK